MKKIILFISTVSFVFCFTNCKEKTYFKEVISGKNVSIAMAEFPKNNEDFVLTIPLELSLYLNNFQNILRVGIYYEKDNRLCSEIDDYLLYESKTDKVIFSLDSYEYPNYPSGIYLIERKMKISKAKAKKLIEKYNSKASVEDIKTINDTISLVSYKNFREDNPEFVRELRRIPDSITFVIQNKKEKKPIQIKARINW
ncbi:hypothetical protein BSF41_16920 [Flavobacterium sp. ACN2]|jgi:hypothetical protein|uniref:hypothetical protein n=1 Tax=Flavobacterium sp. ACN2 TaxID=1975676 RepID=UPI000BB39E0A|nr:hypothetical protein [Flavobacterium sp. ACN2]PBI90986.1 hypothetical protein BSF41_16920 [Flavobacterium sp. ACN2]